MGMGKVKCSYGWRVATYVEQSSPDVLSLSAESSRCFSRNVKGNFRIYCHAENWDALLEEEKREV
jgi:hypothetical protein